MQYSRKKQHLLYRASPHVSTRCAGRALESHCRLFLQTNQKSYNKLTILVNTVCLVICNYENNIDTIKLRLSLILLTNKSQQALVTSVSEQILQAQL